MTGDGEGAPVQRAESRASGDAEFTEREGDHRAGPGQAVGGGPTGQVADLEADQEGAQDDGGRDRVRAAERAQHSLPSHLVDQRAEAGRCFGLGAA